MTDTVYSFGQLKNLLTPILLRNNVRRAVLFGSYGKGIATSKSDIDLFVDSGLRGLDFIGLIGEVTDAVDKSVDLIDVTEVIPGSRIEKEIGATGILIYEK
jgi:predicted nucleotidyltransferase